MKSLIKILLLVLFLCSTQSNAEIVLGTGYDWSEGSYGSPSTTTMVYSPFSIKYLGSEWNMKITIPYISMTGPSATVDGSGNIISATGSITTTKGLGDVVTQYSYQFPGLGNNQQHYIDGTIKLKLPTAKSSEHLGTGKADLSVQLDYYYADKRFMPFMTIGYKKFGQPTGYSLNPIWFVSAGGQMSSGNNRAIGALCDYQQPSTSSSTNKLELMGYISINLTKKWSSSLYYVKGMTDSSVDNEAGFTLSVKM